MRVNEEEDEVMLSLVTSGYKDDGDIGGSWRGRW